MSLIEKIDDLLNCEYSSADHETSLIRDGLERAKDIILSEQKEPCKGCQHDGEYENEVEYGYPSPCIQCKRRYSDNYLNQPYTEDKADD